MIQAGTHAVAQGILSSVQGEAFLSSAASGFLGSLGASAFGAIAKEAANTTVETLFFGAVSGASVLNWQEEISGRELWLEVLLLD
ncbi:hypothetical protein [Chryseobacterium gossypii]|uniref:hypothetical protein n=1 Tax=Chryseobacterium gossypii TaxID=3231602 RepID=UPI0035234989